METHRVIIERRIIDGKEYAIDLVTTMDYDGSLRHHYEVRGHYFVGYPINDDIRRNVIAKPE